MLKKFEKDLLKKREKSDKDKTLFTILYKYEPFIETEEDLNEYLPENPENSEFLTIERNTNEYIHDSFYNDFY